MNQIARIPLPHNDLDRHAAALSDIKDMHDQLTDALATIGQLRADLHREQDRVTMLVEERDKYRADADLLRNQLLKMCTTVVNMGLLAREAEAVLMTVDERATETVKPPAVDFEA